MRNYILPVLFLIFSVEVSAQNIRATLQRIVDSFYEKHPEAIGFLVHVEAPEKQLSWSYAVGYADTSTHQKLLADQPVLIASNTKPYVAASIMQLVKKKQLSIDQPIEKLISGNSAQQFLTAGYDLHTITVKHLLSHTSGIRDYVDEEYFRLIQANKKHLWTRDEQIARAAQAGKPLANPGDTFRYADINYVLLTEVIEHFTRKPFYLSIRKLLNYNKLHLHNTWFTKLETPPTTSLPPSHQYWKEYQFDTYELDPSWDLYGGGGMIATVKDLAVFFQKLFAGKVIKNKELVAKMHEDVPPNLEVNYCLGIRKIKVSGLITYSHGGGLGTDVAYIPSLHATVSIAVIEASERPLALRVREELIRELKQP